MLNLIKNLFSRVQVHEIELGGMLFKKIIQKPQSAFRYPAEATNSWRPDDFLIIVLTHRGVPTATRCKARILEIRQIDHFSSVKIEIQAVYQET